MDSLGHCQCSLFLLCKPGETGGVECPSKTLALGVRVRTVCCAQALAAE